VRDQILQSWTFEPWLAATLVAVACVYLRGAIERARSAVGDGDARSTTLGTHDRAVRASGRGRLQLRRGCTPRRVVCYLGGLLAIWLALASPLESFAPLLLSAHMGQHMLLTMVAAPLLLLGEPLLPLLRGLPAVVRRDWCGPFIASAEIRRAGRRLVHPIVAWSLFTIVLIAWHVPMLYELALRDPFWHRVEHACLFASAVMFWWPVVQPAPSRAWWPKWALVPYLLVADIVNTVFAAIFAFAPSVIYPTYTATAPALGIDALRDQAAAGAIMWVPGSIAYLVPAAVLLVGAMRPRSWREQDAARTRSATAAISLPQLNAHGGRRERAARSRFDLLRVPLVGAILKSRGARLGLRIAMLVTAASIVIDGLLGPREAPMNMAGTLPWTHWRGAAVLLLLIGGNFLCMTCPFVLPRMMAQRWQRWRQAVRGRPGSIGDVVVGTMLGALPAAMRRASASTARSRWPRALRNKWTAVVLIVIWLVIYEAFDLWASPAATAWVIVAYFMAAFIVDAFASGGAFCKWVCPLGQFHFVQSSLSPLTVAVRDETVCATCTTHDCIRGNEARNGCELELFVPRKQGNLDCTFCLDCVDACPHENVGILSHAPGAELRSDAWRSSLGRLSNRPDVAALVLVLSAGAIANAAGMTGPVLDGMARVSEAMHWSSWSGSALVVLAMLVAPVVLVVLAAMVTRTGSQSLGERVASVFTSIALATAPLGAAVWLVHFAFHLVTSWRTAGPVITRAANELGVISIEPAWTDACCSLAPTWLLPANLLTLSLGTALSLWTLARRLQWHEPKSRIIAWLPGALVIIALWTAAAWVFFQPMDMRGTFGWGVAP